jgi:hypothetical protein
MSQRARVALACSLICASVYSPTGAFGDAVRLAPDCKPLWKAYVEETLPNATDFDADEEAIELQKRAMALWTEQVRREYGAAYASTNHARKTQRQCWKKSDVLVSCVFLGEPCSKSRVTLPGAKIKQPNIGDANRTRGLLRKN